MNSVLKKKVARHSMSHGSACIIAEKDANSHSSYHSIKVYWLHKNGSLKDLHFLLKILGSIKRDISKGQDFDIFWYYDHKTQLDMGWDIARLFDLRFTFRHVGEGE